jgi:HK97 family phage portal protein
MWPFSRKSSPTPVAAKSIGGGVPAQGFLPTLGAIPSAAGVLISQATAMTVSTVYACVSIRSEDVARCAPTLRRPLKDGSFDVVTDHPVAKLFKRPNRAQTWFEFVEQMQAALLLRGNAYAVILRDNRGRPKELIPVNPDAVMVLEASDGSIFYNTNRVGLFQIAALRDLPVAIPAEDMFHLRGLAFNITAGSGRLSFARDSIGLAMAQEQQAARWMQNGARPSGVLQIANTLTEPAAKRLQSQWASLFSGIQNVGAVPILEEGLEWKPMTLSAEDLEFLAQRKFSVEDVTRWFRMPPHKVGVTDANSKLNQAQADQAYVNETIMPDLERWEQKFERAFDLDAEGLEVVFDESSLLRADIMTRVNVGRLMTLSGLAATNEWRRSERMGPVESLPKGPGWEVRAPLNTGPLGSDMTGVAADGAGRPRGSGNKEPGEE